MPTLDALGAILREDDRQEKWQTYVADMACLIVKRLSRKFEMPLYSAIDKPKENRTDSRSGAEIVQSIIEKRRRKRRGGGEPP